MSFVRTLTVALALAAALPNPGAARVYLQTRPLYADTTVDGAPFCARLSPVNETELSRQPGHCRDFLTNYPDGNQLYLMWAPCDPSNAGCAASLTVYCDGLTVPQPWRAFVLIRERPSETYRIYTAKHVIDEMNRSRAGVTGCDFWGLQLSTRIPGSALGAQQTNGRDIAWYEVDAAQIPDALRQAALPRLDQGAVAGLSNAERTRVCVHGRPFRSEHSYQIRCLSRAEARVTSRDTESGGMLWVYCVPTVQGFSGAVVTATNNDGSAAVALGIHIGTVGQVDATENNPTSGSIPPPTIACDPNGSSASGNAYLPFPRQ